MVIVVDASMVASMVLPDERSPPPDVVAELARTPLAAPAHWPVETGNMLLVARRRGRIDDPAWAVAFARIQALRVAVAVPMDWQGLKDVTRLAEEHRLTLYDAAYLHQAIASSATLATLGGEVIRAARKVGVKVLTFP